MKTTGRPTKYKPEYAKQAYNYCLLGATDKELTQFFEVSKQTLNTWKKSQPEFMDSLKKGKAVADGRIAEALYNRALGYEHKEDKIFQHQGEAVVIPTIKHYPPDTTACIFWLKNRRPDLWRDRQEIKHEAGEPNEIEVRIVNERSKPEYIIRDESD